MATATRRPSAPAERLIAEVLRAQGAFFDAARRPSEEFLRDAIDLPPTFDPLDAETIRDAQLAYQAEFQKRSAERLRLGMRRAMAQPTRQTLIRALRARQRQAEDLDVKANLERQIERVRGQPDPRRQAVVGLLEQERRLAQAHAAAMAGRARSASRSVQVRAESPTGALWRRDPLSDSCQECRFMDGRLWPWEVLERISPPRHPNCRCVLVPVAAARRNGWVAPRARVPSAKQAIHWARGLLRESVSGALLVEMLDRGLLREDFAEHKHWRDPHGRWRDMPGVSVGRAPTPEPPVSAEHRLLLDGIRQAVVQQPERIQHGDTRHNSFWIVDGKVHGFPEAPHGAEGLKAISVHSHGSQRDDAFSSGDFYAWFWHMKRDRSEFTMAVIYADGTADTMEVTDDTDPAVVKWGEKRWFDNVRGDRASVRAFAQEHGFVFTEGLRWASPEEAAGLDERRGGRYVAEAWGSTAAHVKQAASQLRVGGGHEEGGQFTKKVVPAIGTGGPKAGRPAVGSTPAPEAHTLFRPDGKTIFGHTLPPDVREATPEERKAARIPPGYPLGYVTQDGEPLESGIVGWGVDSQGRIKRFYTPESEALRQKQKFERIRVLSGKLSDLDRTLREEAGVDDRAAVAMLVRATGMRPGSESKTGGAKQAFGATTLQAQHVTIDGDLVSFDFIGKNGKTIQFETHNRVLAAALEPHLEGKSGSDQVFQNVNEKNVNAYLKGVLGDEFKTKDLRTVLATATARARVDEIDPEDIHDLKPAERKRLRTEICTEISERLGNTPAEVQKSYVDPGVWDALGL